MFYLDFVVCFLGLVLFVYLCLMTLFCLVMLVYGCVLLFWICLSVGGLCWYYVAYVLLVG